VRLRPRQMSNRAAQLVINQTISHTLRVTFFRATGALGGLDAHRVFDADVTISQTTMVPIWQITLLHPAIHVGLGMSRSTAT
jgi:hypothetical protein